MNRISFLFSIRCQHFFTLCSHFSTLWTHFSTFCLLFYFLCSPFPIGSNAQSYKNRVKYAPQLTDEFLLTDSAAQVAKRVIDSQLPTGAWPKNVNFFATISDSHDPLLGTIDNGATLTEIRFLMRYAKVRSRENPSLGKKKRRGKDSPSIAEQGALRGIRYLLEMQYPNGGFPQYYPRNDHYHAYITFNDNAMVGALRLLRDVAKKVNPFQSVHDTLAQQCQEAYDRGIGCILQCQIVLDSVPTLWCQQHDPVTLEPRPARAFEHAWIVTAESVGILRLLMDEQNSTTCTPSRRDSILRAVSNGKQWLVSHAIHGYQRTSFTNEQGKPDYRITPCSECLSQQNPADSTSTEQGGKTNECKHLPRFWARFYTLDTQQPVFCGRDAVPRSRVEDIDYERRNGYAWFGKQPESILSKK